MPGRPHTELARRVARQEVALHDTRLHHPAGLGSNTFIIERRTALAFERMRVFVDVDMRRQHGLAQTIDEEARLAVQRAARGGLHESTEQAGGQGRLEKHRHFGSRHTTRLEPGQRPLGGVAADDLGRRQIGSVAHRGVPAVALHVLATTGNRRNGKVMARTRIAAAKSARIAGPEMRLLRRDTRAFGVRDAAVGAQRRVFAAPCQLGGLRGVDGPGMKQIEIARGFLGLGQVIGLGQAGGGVFGREAGDVVGGPDRLLQGFGREIRGTRVATLLPQIDADAQALVAVALDVLELALAHRNRQADAFGYLGPGIAGAELACQRQGVFDDLLELVLAVGKQALFSAGGGCRQRVSWGGRSRLHWGDASGHL